MNLLQTLVFPLRIRLPINEQKISNKKIYNIMKNAINVQQMNVWRIMETHNDYELDILTTRSEKGLSF